MSLRVNHLVSFGGGGLSQIAGTLIELTLASDVANYNIFSAAQAAGGPFDPADNVTDGLVRIILQNNVFVYSVNTGLYALTAGSGWGTGWAAEVVVQDTNVAYVIGAGGAGGAGGRFADLIFPPDWIQYFGGGGGGGGGKNNGAGASGGSPLGNPGSNGTNTTGGSGGIGKLVGASSGFSTVAASNGSPGGPALINPTTAVVLTLRAEGGGTLNVWGGGGGGAGGHQQGGNGGNGGDPGSAGAGNGIDATGGAAGTAITGPGTVNQSGDIDTDGP